ncbi:MAG: glycine zipper 2TM domain-containing protein [Desulfuromonadales bacterium]|nr:glycine zipper 2TM domain-containing protein [Desulfuromonadales bacterium]
MIKLRFLLMLIIAATLTFSYGCAPSTSGSVYSRDQTRTPHSVFYGTVLRAELVTIEGEPSAIGAIAGGVLGGVLGSSVGGGSGQDIATVGGALAGAAAGSAIEKGMGTEQGVELEVELDSGELMIVVQELDDEYNIGDRVRLVKDSKGVTRVRQ